MLALTLDQARTVGFGLIAVLVLGAVFSAWLFSKVIQKVVFVVVLLGLGLAVWSQRESLEDCADRVQVDGESTTCTFFGRDVTIG